MGSVVKSMVAATSSGGGFGGAKVMQRNPCDDHTLKGALKQEVADCPPPRTYARYMGI